MSNNQPSPGSPDPFDDDELSTTTPKGANTSVKTESEVREIVVKLSFRPDKDQDGTCTHSSVIKQIRIVYPEVRIFDNKGIEVKDNDEPINSYQSFMRRFKLHYVKANTNKKISAMYFSYFRMYTPVPLSEIKRNGDIMRQLSKLNVKMNIRHWKEDEVRITNLGFFVEVDPTNFIQSHFEEYVKNKISFYTKRPIRKIPKFRCIFSSPFHISQDGSRVATKAYSLKVRQSEAKYMINLLQTTHMNCSLFVFHKIHHSDLHVYLKAIRKQNGFLAKTRVTPIQGINEEIMFHLEQEVVKLDGCYRVLRHRESMTTGRWNIQTDEQNMKKAIDSIRNTLLPQVQQLSTMYPNDPTYKPSLAFKSDTDEDSSDGTFQSYISACSSLLSFDGSQTENYNTPPAASTQAPQFWGDSESIPTSINPGSIDTPKSAISSDEIGKL